MGGRGARSRTRAEVVALNSPKTATRRLPRSDLDTNLNKQASARRERDMKLTTMDADIDTVMATMRATVKQTGAPTRP